MSSKNQTRRVRKNPEPDLSTQYHKIGIKAVAAAAHNKTKEPGGITAEQERKKRLKEKVNG